MSDADARRRSAWPTSSAPWPRSWTGSRPVIDDARRAGSRPPAHELALVGGPVRDAMLGRPHNDLDFTTSARPEETERLLAGWADAIWDMGRDFGTIGCRKGDWQVEVTTYRSEAYDPASRKPAVDFGDIPRPATSAAATSPSTRWRCALPGREFVDPYGGVVDLAHRLLRTPGHARGLLLRRPAADDAGGPVRRPARLHRRPRGGRRDDRDGRADRDHLRRAGPRRAGQAGAARRTRGAG